MITFISNKQYEAGKNLVEIACLSTDDKPTDGIANGSMCTEMDTGDVYFFDEAGGAWIKFGSGGGGGGDTGEVWLVGSEYIEQGGTRMFVLANVDETDHKTELFNNADLYSVYLNGTELPYFVSQDTAKQWRDAELGENMTMAIMYETAAAAYAVYRDGTTAPDSVEVSVKAK